MATTTVPILQPKRKGVIGGLSEAWYFIRRWPVIPIFILSVLAITGIFGPLFAPHDPVFVNLSERHVPPAWTAEGTLNHILGTDHAGRDMLSRIIYGARISLAVAAISVSSGFVIGTTIGLVSGYLGGIYDEVITRIVDIWYALPFLMIALVVVFIFGQKLSVLLVLLAMLAWAGFVRIIRAQTLVLKELDYVALARVAGASHARILLRHIFPGVVNSAVVIATLNVGGLILAEASLSFLGAGIPPPTSAWGVLVSEGRNYVQSAWWQTVFPGGAIFLTLMSLNFLGDWIRDRLDPRLRQID
ncbi:MAG: ABC transporter permease [Chloroflexi bacterium]|nr:ABC transporter permease [Chloroflexota bacterium]